MEALLTRITTRRTGAGTDARITFRDGRSEVCASSCRATAHRDRVTTAVHRARL